MVITIIEDYSYGDHSFVSILYLCVELYCNYNYLYCATWWAKQLVL